MNSGCSASKRLGRRARRSPSSTTSCHQTSRPSFQATSWPVRRTTSTCCDRLAAPWPRASSTAGLSADALAAAVAAVGGDDQLGVAVLDPAGERVGGEAAEDHRVRRADPGAGQHRDDGLGDHRQVDRDPVALAARPSSVSALAALQTSSVQLGVGDRRGCRRARPRSGCATLSPWPASTCRSTQLYADVELAADEPLGERRVRPVEHLGPSGWSQVSRSACSAQNASRSAAASVVGLGGDVGVRARSAGGSNRRSSRTRFSRVSLRHVALPLRQTPRPSQFSAGWFAPRMPPKGCTPVGPTRVGRVSAGRRARATCLYVKAVTPANDAYQAASAVARPT